jgi:formylglycine-generating enzyme required for sulfatase activity
MDTIHPRHIYSRIFAALVAIIIAAPAPAQSCAGDLNDDGVINGADLGQLLAAWGPCQSCEADLNANGVVDGADLGVQLGNWGECVTIPTWATVVEAQPDPAVVTDPALLAAIEATGLAWRVRDTATQVEMLLVPPGTFRMGCVIETDQFGCQGQEFPVHQVTLTNAFYLGRYEVTQAQWVATMGSNQSSFQGYSDSPSRPVERVPLDSLIPGFLSLRGYLIATGFRLPSEAEWEYACRAGTQAPFYNGSTDDSTVGALAWYRSNSGLLTRAVGGKLANAFGFHDMLGNVLEWVYDRYGEYSADAQTDPMGPVSGTQGVLRGGSWGNDSNLVRSSYRAAVSPIVVSDRVGFRVARNP